MMSWLRSKKQDEIVVYPDNSIYRNGVLDFKTTIESLGIPAERVGKDEEALTFRRDGVTIKAFCNVRPTAELPKVEGKPERDRAAYMREYRESRKGQGIVGKKILRSA